MKKKQILALAAAVILISLSAKGTLTYFTAETVTHNVITSGHVRIALEEKQELTPGVETDFPAEGIDQALPGDRISKIVRVRNTGSADAWVRIELEISASAGDAALPSILPNGNAVVTATPLPGWCVGADGLYYYEEKLPPGAVTPPLIREVRLDPRMDRLYQGCQVTVSVKAHAVQADHNGSTVSEAVGWP